MPSQPEPLDNRRRNSFDVLRRSAGPSALAALLAVSSVGPSLAKTVHDLDSVPDALRTPFGKEVWRDQMEGKPVADGLGTALPDGLTAEALVNLLAPNRGETPVSGVGAKPWPSQPGRFVAVVCTGGSVPAKPDDDKCSADHRGAGKAPLVAHVGVVERGPDGALRLVGGAVAVDGRLSWRDSGLPAQPEDPDDRDGTGDDSKLAPSSFKSLDLAPYRLGPDQPAFALRAAWMDGYASGVGEHGAAFVFAIVEGRLRPVLAVPMSSFLMTAGDWHKDGTREHDVEEGENVIVTSPILTDGHFDWVVKNVSGPWRRIYRWSAAQGRYVAETQGREGSSR